MAPEYAESIVEIVKSRLRFRIAAIDQEAVCSQ
jgi:hypothetical protein